jgi:hypothetical protein
MSRICAGNAMNLKYMKGIRLARVGGRPADPHPQHPRRARVGAYAPRVVLLPAGVCHNARRRADEEHPLCI